MKEFTIEEKSPRYDGNYKTYIELINRLEDVKDAIKKQNYGIAMDILCKSYPEYQITASTELKEGDERIRKEICDFICWAMDRGCITKEQVEKSNSWLAWLEKKGEQKCVIDEGKSEIDYCFAKMMNGEKVSPTWSKENMDIINGMIMDYEGEIEHLSDSAIDEQAKPIYQERINFLNRLKSLYPVKQEWSENDENEYIHILKTINLVAKEQETKGYNNLISSINWFNSLKDRVQPQNLTVTDEELSQAKKDAYNDALDKIEYHSGEPTFDDGWDAAIWYLKKKKQKLYDYE